MNATPKHKTSTYVSKPPNELGFVAYDDTENATWATLYANQTKLLPGRCVDEFMAGIELLSLSAQHIPQTPDLNIPLRQATGWQAEPVAAIIPVSEFFGLLANKKFPAATFIRRPEELHYIEEPDIFHELFGHCPLLTFQAYADYMQAYGEVGLRANKRQRELLGRLFWYTVEFGLIHTANGLRIYGGGILSSPEETTYALESNQPERRPFDPILAMRTPNRIDILQTVYYVIDNYEQLYDLVNQDLLELANEADALGDLAATFPEKN